MPTFLSNTQYFLKDIFGYIPTIAQENWHLFTCDHRTFESFSIVLRKTTV